MLKSRTARGVNLIPITKSEVKKKFVLMKKCSSIWIVSYTLYRLQALEALKGHLLRMMKDVAMKLGQNHTLGQGKMYTFSTRGEYYSETKVVVEWNVYE